MSTVAAQDAAAFRNLAARKPVVGRNDVADFARSHTGALATSWRTTRAALRHAGAVLVDDERQLTDAVTALSALRLPPAADPGVGVVTAQASPVADRAAIGEILAALGDLLVANPALEAVEINPLRVTGQGLLALDAVVTLAEPAAPKETDHA